MESLDLENFVSRLVDNFPSPRRSERWLVPDAGVQEAKKQPASFICEWDEYSDDRYAFLRQQEVPRNFTGRRSVSHRQRMATVDWMVDFHTAAAAISGGRHLLSLESLFLSVGAIDRFLSTSQGDRLASSKDRLGLEIACVACLGLGVKYEESKPPSLLELAVTATSLESGVLGGSNSCRERVDEEGSMALKNRIVDMEQCVSSALDYRMAVPTPLSFLEVFMRRDPPLRE